METNKNNWTATGLPYVNNLLSILITILCNVLCILLFTWNSRIALTSVLVSAVCCGAATSFINTLIASGVIRKMRAQGALPPLAPESRLMMRLPRNPLLLALLFAVFFSALAALLNFLLIRFFEIQTFTLPRLIVWQAAYSCPLTAIISECAVLRYIQPDCAEANDPAQTGVAKVKNPLSRLTALKNWLGAVLVDFGFNMVIGLALGATRVAADHSVIINPITRDGIAASSVVIGLIVTFRMAYPIMKSMRGARDGGSLPAATARNGFLSALPDTPLAMTLTLALPIILLSFAVFWSVLTFFDFAVLSFFQFFVIRSAYTAILSKGVIALAIARYRQPKIIREGAAAA